MIEISTEDPKIRPTKIDFEVRAVLEQSTDDPHSWKPNIFETALEFSIDIEFDVRAVLEHSNQNS